MVNHESGIKHGNEIVRIPDARRTGPVDEVQQRPARAVPATAAPKPRLFDGSRAPRIADLVSDLPCRRDGRRARCSGSASTSTGSAAAVRLPATRAATSGCSASVGTDAVRVLGRPRRLAGRPVPGRARWTSSSRRWSRRRRGRPTGWRERFAAPATTRRRWGSTGSASASRRSPPRSTARLGGTATGTSRSLVVLYAADAADARAGARGHRGAAQAAALRPGDRCARAGLVAQRASGCAALLTWAPRSTTWGPGSALDVQGSELRALVPGMLLNWSPRPGRGLFFDRAQHATPEVVIVPSLEEP